MHECIHCGANVGEVCRACDARNERGGLRADAEAPVPRLQAPQGVVPLTLERAQAAEAVAQAAARWQAYCGPLENFPQHLGIVQGLYAAIDAWRRLVLAAGAPDEGEAD